MVQSPPTHVDSPSSSKREIPLSFSQERLWFLDHLEPGNPVHNLALAYRLTGRLDRVALEGSVNEIVRRHETLRTIFPSVGGQPGLIIREDLPLPLKDVDLRSIGQSDRETVTRDLVIKESRIPFDLAQGPLVRVCLFRLSEDDRVFLLVTHRIISDDASLEIFFRELWLIYEALADKRCSPLPDLSTQYTEFSIGQRLSSANLEKQRAYWKQQLIDCPPSLQLATDSPRPSKKNLSRCNLPNILVPFAFNDPKEHFPTTTSFALHLISRSLQSPPASLHRTGRHRGGRDRSWS